MTICETARLRLRQLTEGDASFLRRLNDNPNVYRYTGDGPLADDAAALAVLHTRIFPQYARHGVGRWAVELLGEAPAHATIGWCGLRFDEAEGQYDLGYRFLEEHWGRGYATEAARATLSWARERLPGARIVARARVENTASHGVLRRMGMVPVGEDDDCDGRVTLYELPRVANNAQDP